MCKKSFIFCESISHLENSQGNLSVRAMDFIVKEVDESENRQPIAIDEETWIHSIAKFLTASEALRLRAVASQFNNDYIVGEYGPLLFFLSRTDGDFPSTSNRSETNLLKERSGNTLL